MDVKELADLIYIYDAYKILSRTLFGTEMVLDFHQGCVGAFGRIYNVIENSIAEKYWDENFKTAELILNNTKMEPEERAKKLLEKN